MSKRAIIFGLLGAAAGLAVGHYVFVVRAVGPMELSPTRIARGIIPIDSARSAPRRKSAGCASCG